jgi:hypothetical protein
VTDELLPSSYIVSNSFRLPSKVGAKHNNNIIGLHVTSREHNVSPLTEVSSPTGRNNVVTFEENETPSACNMYVKHRHFKNSSLHICDRLYRDAATRSEARLRRKSRFMHTHDIELSER